MLRIAIQAKGRLNEKTMALLADAGISASVGSRSLIAHAKGFPVDLLLLRDDDIPQAVAMGTADLGIVGLNEVEEKGVDVHRIIPLGFGGCRLSLAVPREADYKVLESQSVLIATPDLPAEKQEELDKLCFRFRSIIESRGMKYVLMNLPKSSLDEALKILPGMKSPTILHLADPEWLSLHAVIPESQLWEKIEQLKGIGAEDILVLVLENIVK